MEIKTISDNLSKLQEFKQLIKSRQNELDALRVEQEKDWTDVRRNIKVKSLEDFVGSHKSLVQSHQDFLELFKIMSENELEGEYKKLIEEFNKFYLATLLSDTYDENDCIINITAGAGGTEAQDWAEMVMRMLLRFCETKNFTAEIEDKLDGDGAGIKGASIAVKGLNAYGILKSENGVHRLVRISPFDSQKRRHTSFAAVDIVPVIEKPKLVIEDKELQVDTYRASGAGGQHVNRTESAVRITHLPTGTVVTCQSDRSQIKNRATAMQALISKLEFIQHENEQRRLKNLQPLQQKIEWGSQIRSYVLCPYTLAKDHRTGAETSNVLKVLDGDIDLFSDAYLIYLSRGEK